MINESSVKEYDSVKLGNAFDDSNKIKDLLLECSELLSKFKFSDSRLTDYYKDYLQGISESASTLKNSGDSINGTFIPWLSELLELLKSTIAAVNAKADQQEQYSSGDDEVSGGDHSSSDPSGADGESPSGDSVDTPSPTSVNPAPVVAASPDDSFKDVENKETETDKTSKEDLDDVFDAKKSEVQSTDPTDKYKIKADWTNLKSVLQAAMVVGLQSVGYSDNEVEEIVKGDKGIPKVVLGTVGGALKETQGKHSDLRAKLKKKYGFDIFTDEGKIIPAALAGLLFIDLKDSNDKYDIVAQLKNDYGVTLVDQKTIDELKEKLEEAYKNNPDLREELKKKYGFDIIDEDGKVSESNLTLAKIMDDADEKDSFDMDKMLTNDEEETPTPTEIDVEEDDEDYEEETTDIEVPTSTPTETPSSTEIEVPTSTPTETPSSTDIEVPTSTPSGEVEEIIIGPTDEEVVPTVTLVVPAVAPVVSAYNPGSPSYSEVEVAPPPETIPEVVPEEVPVEQPTEEVTELDPAEDEISRLTSIKPQVATAKNDFPVAQKPKDNSGLAALAGIGATIGSAAAGAWLINKNNEHDSDDEDEDEDEVEYLSEDEKPLDINPDESEENVTEIGLKGANLAAEEETYVAKGSSVEDGIPESKEFLNELDVKDEEPDSSEEEFDYYTAHRDDSVATNVLEEI